MAKTFSFAFCFLFLAIALTCTNAARILEDVDAQPSNTLTNTPQAVGPATTLPSGQIPATTVGTPAADDEPATTDPPVIPAPVIPEHEAPATNQDEEPEAPAATAAPEEDDTPVETPIAPPVQPPQAEDEEDQPEVAPPVSAAATTVAKEPHLSFYMHDIIGGTHPSARVVTGIIAQTEVNGIPFSKPNNNFFPIQGGVPLLNNDINGIVNQNNLPFLAGLNGAQTSTVIQNSGDNNIVSGGDNQPFVSAGQLPSGATLQKLMFGTVTVIDDELTEAHELGSAVIGKAQGFYLASSLDGTSQSLVLTLLLHGGEHEHEHEVPDTISLFGVHRTASHESQVAVIGGTGKYENAKGYATVETLHQEDQHATDGIDTIVHFSVYLSE